MRSSPNITRVELRSIYGHHNISVDLKPGLNIVHGRNGAGKTTLLHVLANLLEYDLERFCYIKFASIKITVDSGVEIELKQNRTKDLLTVELFLDGKSIGEVPRGEDTPPALRLVLRERLGGRPVYLPAFRAVLEAAFQSRRPYYESELDRVSISRIASQESERINEVPNGLSLIPRTSRKDRLDNVAYKTFLCRRWFGEFVPLVRYPSILEVSREINNELQQARLEIASKDQQALADVFVNVLDALLRNDGDQKREDIESVSQRVISSLTNLEPGHAGLGEASSKVRELLISHAGELSSSGEFVAGVLKVYDKALRQRTEFTQHALSHLRQFESSVNRFLEDKSLSLEYPRTLRPLASPPVVRLADGSLARLEVLSSGERHVLTLLFSATHMTPAEGMVLIDEPELSLHVAWQRLILGELMEQAGDRQIIACTHAPEVAAEHSDALVELEVQGTVPDAVVQITDEDMDEEV